METTHVEDVHISMSVQIPLKDVDMLPDKDHIEQVLYYACISGYRSLGDISFTQLGYICSRHQKDSIILCQLFGKLMLCSVYLMILKNLRFENYMVKYSREKVKKEIDKLISISCFQK